jgi:ferredoxin-thioredoxin reductase catalytic chain
MELNSKNEKELKESAEDYAKKVGIQLNSDKKQFDWIADALLKRKEKFGEIYCPCRVITGNKEKDKEIICPCIFHRGEIELQGHCKCDFFVEKS